MDTKLKTRDDIRNIAIIAHVDHGKTTLVNEMLKQSDTLAAHTQIEDRALDSNAIERERGITILSKNTAVKYGDKQINILDTPGHADFGGEVERIMRMVDGVLLVVDAFEGTMPQTRFVLKKALEQHLTPIVVINKVDREGARPEEVVDEVLDLFIELGADEEQLDFPVIYVSAMNGTSSYDSDISTQEHTMKPVFDTIINRIPAPIDNSDEPLQFQVALLDYNDFVGRIGIGRIFRGKIKVGDNVTVMKLDGSKKNFRVTKLMGFIGLKKVDINEAKAGDLIAVSGMEEINVGETVVSPSTPEALPILRIDAPTLQMTFGTNTSPFSGQDGKFVTARQLGDRLKRELHTDVSLRVEDTDQPGSWVVSGRGELHLSILIETLRREGYELQASRPEVIYREIDGQMSEPFESVQIDTPDEYTGSIIDTLSQRKAEMQNMETTDNGQTRLTFLAPSRGLIGYSTEFLSLTRGYGIMNHTFEKYLPVIKGWNPGRKKGTLVSMNSGKATTYAMMGIESRGELLINPGTEVYEGMIVGQNNRENDITVNITKGKNLTNVRAAGSDDMARIKTPTHLTLEESLEFLNEDELCEVTPNFIRLRKKILNTNTREKEAKRRKHS
ncbi:translational GTPase TypA [Lentilactobacillus hilgardii]|uniref:Large ribosomal subunit assembly factor BipA n=1 Tax=Lentilactobacillus hilgardii (strain ATCC 8290 / DSM 20176 / CCUG 30140 / JCM 1155 / KCTC 3500 / NBRC 15886 / NCIMB 8040 / NRRL B-1843 / 9) TaxID=1423757 RepID=C0XKP5_LENH9|nr:translational GTPase TypA [Lentilactobacillus hilgardii]EEI19879.1 GTP-binding protein TypA [Lentilactobacillus buchneri ATCC 11577]EEI24040.1 GTP-binding protein TypA [Lentilactobacillus hilgardii DSM 20176 = ATCC 8290]KRK57951.1 GTP-binding protein TypA [Lentilactobacillus hilgardii DSM 20176 = ATCC 8290]MCT3396762.1 translational GTPase TypA [Lentilactobacillus hilgardii]QEU38261.1 translational GTPase TypA [Lentilactobacillus hilgardii]